AVPDDVDAQDDPGSEKGQRGDPHGVVRSSEGADTVAASSPLVLLPLTTEQEGHAHHGAEQDELLADRVDAAVVERDGVDAVRGVSLRDGSVQEHLAVRAPIVAERWRTGDPPTDSRGDADRTDHSDDQANAARHRSRPLTLASARSTR